MRYGLVPAGVAMGFGGAVVAAAANFPGGEDSSRDTDGWLTWVAVALAVLWVGWAIVVAVGRQPRARIVASALLGAACAAGLVTVLVRMPGRGIDPSFPLTALGLVLGILGAIALIAGSTRWLDRDVSPRTRIAAGGAAVVIAALLTTGLAVGAVPAWVVHANTSATTPRGAPQHLNSTLNGSVAWQSRMDGPAHPVVGTAGGLAVLEPDGVRMLDPASGRQRWSFHRWDAYDPGRARRPGSYAVSQDGRSLAVTYRFDIKRWRYLDDLRYGQRVWVFDTGSGRVRADFELPEYAPGLLAVAGERVLVHVPRGDAQAVGGDLAAVGSGGIAWRRPIDGGCRPATVAVPDRDVLAALTCRHDDALVRIDGDTGEARWTWRSERYTGYKRPYQPLLAVVGDIAVLDLRPQRIGDLQIAHHLIGVRLADGTQAWRRPEQRYGEMPPLPVPGDNGSLHAGAGIAVFAEQHASGTGRATRQTIALRTFHAATGEPAWSVDLPDSAYSVAEEDPPVALLPDGRLVLAYRDLPAQGTPDFCVVGAWDAATGQQRAQLRLRRSTPDAAGGRCGAASLVDVRSGVVLQVPERGLLMLH